MRLRRGAGLGPAASYLPGRGPATARAAARASALRLEAWRPQTAVRGAPELRDRAATGRSTSTTTSTAATTSPSSTVRWPASSISIATGRRSSTVSPSSPAHTRRGAPGIRRRFRRAARRRSGVRLRVSQPHAQPLRVDPGHQLRRTAGTRADRGGLRLLLPRHRRGAGPRVHRAQHRRQSPRAGGGRRDLRVGAEGTGSPAYDRGIYAPTIEMAAYHFHRLLAADLVGGTTHPAV